MKYLLPVYFFFFTTLIVNVYGQSDSKAESIIANAQKKINSYQNISASFEKQIKLGNSKRSPLKIKGKVKIQKNKFRIELSDQIVICNGKKLWSHLIEEDEVTVSDYDQETSFTPNQIFQFSKANMKLRFDGTKTISGMNYNVITMFPTSKQTEYRQVELWLNTSTSLPYQMKIWNRNGSIITYILSSINTTKTISEKEFYFDPKLHPDVEVINN